MIWNQVVDALPQEGRLVLLYSPNESEGSTYCVGKLYRYEDANPNPNTEPENCWLVYEGNEYATHYTVAEVEITHWAYIPNPVPQE